MDKLEALRFYADERNYLREYSYNSDEYMDSVVEHDAGDIAREVLERLEVEDTHFEYMEQQGQMNMDDFLSVQQSDHGLCKRTK